MSDTFDHAMQAYDNWEALEGHLPFGNDVDPIFGYGQRRSRSPVREEANFDEERYGDNLIADMTVGHCRNAVKYLVRTNGSNLDNYRVALAALNKRIADSGESKGFALINLDTGEIEELK